MGRLFKMLVVLIETYWNVKEVDKILEPYAEKVLIETYWNVKSDEKLTFRQVIAVLIETYWNVKYAAAPVSSISDMY